VGICSYIGNGLAGIGPASCGRGVTREIEKSLVAYRSHDLRAARPPPYPTGSSSSVQSDHSRIHLMCT
jgi:hypothetical protein